jgi:hypothetical protein
MGNFDTTFPFVMPPRGEREKEDLVWKGRQSETEIQILSGTRSRIAYSSDSLELNGFWFRDSTEGHPTRTFGHSNLEACTILEAALNKTGAPLDSAWGWVIQFTSAPGNDSIACDDSTRADSLTIKDLPNPLPENWPSRFHSL